MGYRYIGSKARVANDIMNYLGKPIAGSCFIDSFSGTGIIASRAADLGWKIRINDMMHYATIMSEARLVSDKDAPFLAFGGYIPALKELRGQKREGFIWREYSPASHDEIGIERKYFSEENAKQIDGFIAKVHEWRKNRLINQAEFSLLVATLISAANNVANIAGTYGCFLSKWQPQALYEIDLQPLEIRKKKVDYTVSNDDVFNVSSNWEDVIYFDPPYTKRQYASYYHILETIALGDEPKVEGIAGLRPWKDKSSVFCYKVKALNALVNLTIKQNAHRVLISYSDDGHIKLDQFVYELKKTGSVSVMELGFIGRYRPNVTAVMNKQEVKEYLIEYKREPGEK